MLDAIARTGVQANVSLKLTQMGFDIGEADRRARGGAPDRVIEVLEAVHLLLSTNMRVSEVSTAVGYPDPFHQFLWLL